MVFRWQVVVVENGRLAHVQPFRKLNPAKKAADEIASEIKHDSDDVAIWDHALGQVIYNPITGLDLYK